MSIIQGTKDKINAGKQSVGRGVDNTKKFLFRTMMVGLAASAAFGINNAYDLDDKATDFLADGAQDIADKYKKGVRGNFSLPFIDANGQTVESQPNRSQNNEKFMTQFSSSGNKTYAQSYANELAQSTGEQFRVVANGTEFAVRGRVSCETTRAIVTFEDRPNTDCGFYQNLAQK
jgi:hypothetical protein